MNEAMKVFGFVLDNSQDILKQVNQNVYNILGINTQDERLREFVMVELNNFDFNGIERKLIDSIKQVVDSSLKPLENPNENNYETITNNLINNLKSLKLQDYKLEDNFKDLSSRMASKFPMTGINQEQFYTHFMSKTEKINEMIQEYNNEVIDTLIRFSPQFIDEIKQSRIKQTTNNPEPVNPSNPSDNGNNPETVPSDYRRDDNRPQVPNEPTTPDISTYVGATNEQVEMLIESNQYYSLLHGIDRETVMKYNNFIQTGFSLIVNDYYNRASSCTTLDEKLQAFAELKEIYQNFVGYISMDQSNQLREQIENMSNYLQKQQSKQNIDDIGIRYNTENREENKRGRHM